jgi:hypothetical protein
MRARALESTPEGSLWRQIWCASGPDGHESPVPWMTARVGREHGRKLLVSTLEAAGIVTPVLRSRLRTSGSATRRVSVDASTGALESTLRAT